MKLFKKIRSNMSISVIGALVGLMLIFGVVISVVGWIGFENAFRQEYSTVTYHMAMSAVDDVNGDHIDSYLNGEETEEYQVTKERLDKSCISLNISLLYVIKVDTTDYNHFTSIFNSVNNTVDNSNYSPWELGLVRPTTNDEYRTKYQALYEGKKEYETVFRLNPNNGTHPHITTLVSIKNTQGDVTALLCIQRPVREMEKAFAPYLVLIIITVVALGSIIVTISAIFIRKGILAPVEKVSKEATRFAKENTNNKPLGNISKYEAILNLARSIDAMENDMINYIENLTTVTKEKEKIGAELNIASQIQQSSLPLIFPPFPNRDEFDIYASMDPAKEVGGDFYNFFLIDDDHLALVIADVSDKGVPAALFMMVSNILINEKAKVLKDPAKVLEAVNKDLYEHNQASMFVTVWLGILEISTGKLVSANAGHEDPAILHNGKFELKQENHGFVLGAMNGMIYQNQETKLDKGDKIFVYTDGVAEATNSNKEMFGVERMIKSLNNNKDKSPKDILASVRKDVDEFVSDAPQFDDLTMLCIELKKK